jgi:glycosyltransferase involved in cell wall biosynthesis
MNATDQPFVSVITPVYNMADYLAACIESILGQSYRNFEYIIVNNLSTDRTLEIALDYARKDPRIQVHTNKDFVGVMENHNLALALMSPNAKYCKVVCADDFLFPECLAKMVELGESNPSISLIGSYSIAGKKVMHSGLEYEKSVVSGKGLCRATLLGGPYVFGAPTTLLYRADSVRRTRSFYPTSNPHSDTTACYRELENSDFGFVHQVLSYTRIHAESQTSRGIKLGVLHLAKVYDVAQYGPKYLSPAEFKACLKQTEDHYYSTLVPHLLSRARDRKFWQQHRAGLQEAGMTFSTAKLYKAAFRKGFRLLLSPGKLLKKIEKVTARADTIEAQYYDQALE